MDYVAKWFGLVAVTAVMVTVGKLPGYAATRQPQREVTVAQGQTAEARLAEADRLSNEAHQLWRTSQFEAASDTLLQALELYRRPDVQAAFPDESRQSEGQTLVGLGAVSRILGRYEQALGYYTDALAISRELGYREGEGVTLNNIGLVYDNQGQYEQALSYYTDALAILQDIDDRAIEGLTLNNIGTVYRALGQYEQALSYYTDALAILQDIDDPRGEGTTLNNIGLVYDNQSQYEKALGYFTEALAILQGIGDRAGESRTLNNIGLVYNNQSQYEKALGYYMDALTILQAIGDRAGESGALNNIGAVYLNQGQYEQALGYYTDALTIFQDIGDRASVGQTLNHIGAVYDSLGQYEQALDYYTDALTIFQDIGDRAGVGQTLNNIGGVYDRLKQYEQALGYYTDALTIFQDIGDRAGGGATLNNMGAVYDNLGQYEQALGYFTDALAIAQDIGDRAREGSALNNIGAVYRDLGQYEQALRYYTDALAIAQGNGNRASEGINLNNIGYLLEDLGEPELAIAFFKQSVNVREDIRGDIRGLDTALQQSYTDTVADTYRTLADLLLARGEILEAQRVLELLKVQELQEFTRSRVTNLETRDYELDPAEKTVIDAHSSLVAFGLKRSECEASPDCSAATLDALDTQYDQLSAAYNQAVEQLTTQRSAEQEARARQADGQLLQARQELELGNFQGTAGLLTENHPGTVLAYPVVLDDKLWVLWGSAGGVVSAIEVPAGRQRIGDAVLRFRQLMTACEAGGCDVRDIPAVQAVAQELYQYLIPAPLEDELQALQATLPEGQVPNLVIVPDLVTRYIPFAALHDGQQWLVEKYAISTLLSAEQTNADNPLTTLDSTSILGLGLSNPVPEHGFPFPLENVPTELAAIVQTSAAEPGIFRGETHLNDDFDLEKLRLARRHQVLHLATHGVFDPKADSLSFLMLGVGQPLYIRDLKTATNYFQNLSLVVLSACETALSDIDQSGLELASIASTFLEASVDTVVASLWQVSDSATSDLMQQFYGSLAQSTPEQRVSVGQALRQAQLAMLYGNEAADTTSRASLAIAGTDPGAGASDLPRTAHPYYWSAFTIIGNGL